MSSLVSHFHQSHESFTIIPHHLFQLDYLKPDEKYLLMWFKSRPPAFKINIKSLATNLGVGLDVIKRMSHNLQEHKHLKIVRLRSGHTEWHFFEKQEDYVNLHSPLKMPKVEKPHVENPHVDNPPVLVSIDPLVNIDPVTKIKDKDTCSQNREPMGMTDFDILFPMLKKAWPNNNNMKRAESPFRALIKNRPSTESFLLVEHFKCDIQARLKAQQLGFNNMMLSTYLNGERWKDDITNQNNESVDKVSMDKEASAAKGRELFRIK